MDLLLDIYEPVGAKGPRPVVVFIHGGGFLGGSKSAGSAIGLMNYFASRGFVGFSIDYRLAGDEAAAGVKDIKPVIGVETPDIPSTLSDDDPLLNPAGFTPPPLRGSGVQ